MSNSIFNTYSNKPATIDTSLYNSGDTENYKTWEQLSDTDKQNIANHWTEANVYTLCNEVIELVLQDPENECYDDALSIAVTEDYSDSVREHLEELSVQELHEFVDDFDIDFDINSLFRTTLLKEFIDKLSITNYSLGDLCIAYERMGFEYNAKNELEELCVEFINNLKNIDITCNDNFDDFDDCTTILNLGISFDSYIQEFEGLIIGNIYELINTGDVGKYFNLDPAYTESLQYFIVSDHFAYNVENCCTGILGLTVWGRGCCGQAVYLDNDVQLAAFKCLSDAT